jgi:hypothetical protein
VAAAVVAVAAAVVLLLQLVLPPARLARSAQRSATRYLSLQFSTASQHAHARGVHAQQLSEHRGLRAACHQAAGCQSHWMTATVLGHSNRLPNACARPAWCSRRETKLWCYI